MGLCPPLGTRVQSQTVETPKAQAVRLALSEPTGMGFLSCVISTYFRIHRMLQAFLYALW